MTAQVASKTRIQEEVFLVMNVSVEAATCWIGFTFVVVGCEVQDASLTASNQNASASRDVLFTIRHTHLEESAGHFTIH